MRLKELDLEIYITQIDFEKAFDSIEINYLSQNSHL